MNKVISAALLICAGVLSACGSGGSSSSPAPAAVVLNAETTRAVQSVSADRKLVVFSGQPTQLAEIKVGNILVSGISSAAPDGFLLSVTAIDRPASGDLQVHTSQAALEQVIQNATVNWDRQLTQDDVEEIIPMATGVTVATATTSAHPPISRNAKESVSVSPLKGFSYSGQLAAGVQVDIQDELAVHNSLSIDFGVLSVKSFAYQAGADDTLSLSVDASATIAQDSSLDLMTYRFKPFTVLVLDIPVVVRPTLKVSAVIKTNEELKASVAASLNGSAEAAINYSPAAGWSHTHSVNFTPNLTSSAADIGDATIAIKPEFSLQIYGLSGPFIAPTPDVNIEAVNTTDTGKCQAIRADLQLEAGYTETTIETEIFDIKVLPGVDFGKLLLASKLLDSGGDGCTITFDKDVKYTDSTDFTTQNYSFSSSQNAAETGCQTFFFGALLTGVTSSSPATFATAQLKREDGGLFDPVSLVYCNSPNTQTTSNLKFVGHRPDGTTVQMDFGVPGTGTIEAQCFLQRATNVPEGPYNLNGTKYSFGSDFSGINSLDVLQPTFVDSTTPSDSCTDSTFLWIDNVLVIPTAAKTGADRSLVRRASGSILP